MACGSDDDEGGGKGGTGGTDSGTGGTAATGGTGATGGSGGSGGSSGGSSGTGGSPGDAGPDVDAPDVAFVVPTPFAVNLSASGPDQLMSARPGPAGSWYAAGFAATAIGATRLVTVVKLDSTGAFDTTFGTGGIATTTVEFVGGNDEIDLALQSDGKLLVSATVANPTNTLDRDVAILRLTATGTLDSTFGVNGVRQIDLNDAILVGTTLTGMDAARGLAVDSSDGIYLHATQRGIGNGTGGQPRTDTDYTIVKLDADGTVVTGWGTNGKHLLDIQESNATPRQLYVVSGGVIGTGYANSSGVGTTQPVVYKLGSTGALDPSFAVGGVFHDTVLTLQTEVYGAAIHGTHMVTGGYGRDTGTLNDWVSLRFDLSTGARDTTWGGAANGAMFFDPAPTLDGSNCRGALALPGGRTLLYGAAGPGNMPAQDATFAVLSPTGALDTAFGDGTHSFALGTDGNDQFWGAATQGNAAILVGYKGGGTAPTATNNDDAYALILNLP